ncbi:MAG: DUF362 domain-containing protein [Bacillota bacterium]
MSEVACIRALEYGRDKVLGAVRRALSLLGGINRFISPGDRVLIKPNLLRPAAPEQAITTHPDLIWAVATLVKRAGGRAVVGDSSGGTLKGRGMTSTALDRTGARAAALDAGAEVINFDSYGTVEVAGIHISRAVIEADVVISLPKVKTHGLTVYTGAVKNMFGVVPGLLKSRLHRQAPTVPQFSEVLVDIYSACNVKLAVADGILAMEGNGPSAGRPKHLGYIFASQDPVALDAVVESILGIPSGSVLTTTIAARRGLGVADLSAIRVLGDQPVKTRFQLPDTTTVTRLPGFLSRWALDLMEIVPKISKRCTGCAVCVSSCPVSAIEDPSSGIRMDRCIRCLCCHELCPSQAVDLIPRHPTIRRIGSYLAKRSGRL